MKNVRMKATSLRSILIILFILTLAILSAVFYFAINSLDKFSTDIKIDSPSISSNNITIEENNNLEVFIQDNKTLIDKINNFAISSEGSQNIVTSTINKYASDTGLSVSLNFESSVNDNTPDIGSYTKKYVTASINSPVDYVKLINFLALLEDSIPILQISAINISTTNNDDISIDPITIRYYVK